MNTAENNMALYMTIHNVKGNVRVKGFEGAILLYSLIQLGSRAISHAPGMGCAHEMSSLTLNPVRITKGHDAASPLLYDYFCCGKNIDELRVFHCPSASHTANWRTQYTLHNVAICTHHELINSEGSYEIMELVYTKIEKGYKQQDAQGNLHSPSFTGYDLITATRA